jgi:tagaturonate reductase
MSPAILQFGTSRFLQAHVDLFVSQALKCGDAGQAVGGILVVQTTRSPASAARIAALAADEGYPVRVRGLHHGQQVDELITCRGVRQAVQADAAWDQVRLAVRSDVRVIVSNTADRGYQLDASDGPDLLAHPDQVPRSFPAKLLVLLHHRWQVVPAADLSIYPCELVERNGDVLRGVVTALATQWGLDTHFIAWLHEHCVWANSLVDRIVSEAIDPVGAVAEPYALWAIEHQPGLVLPCVHEAIVVTDDLDHYERLKLFLLNAAHTFLAEDWQQGQRASDETVCQAMNNAAARAEVEALWAQEILPVFEALGQRDEAQAYVAQVRERFLNPFLAHRIADIAQNHGPKKQRRLAPIIALAEQLGCALDQPRLRAAMARVA